MVFLWGDLITIPLPGGGSLGLSLLVLLLISHRNLLLQYAHAFLPVRMFPDMIHAMTEKKGAGRQRYFPPSRHLSFPLPPEWAWETWSV